MSHIPDCRTDDYYNEKYLNDVDREFIRGFDYAIQMLKANFDNLDVYPEAEELLTDNVAIIKEGKTKILLDALQDGLECDRDEIITSMIDEMADEEHEAIKKRVDAEEQTGRKEE